MSRSAYSLARGRLTRTNYKAKAHELLRTTPSADYDFRVSRATFFCVHRGAGRGGPRELYPGLRRVSWRRSSDAADRAARRRRVLAKWRTRSTNDLLAQLRTTMPPESPAVSARTATSVSWRTSCSATATRRATIDCSPRAANRLPPVPAAGRLAARRAAADRLVGERHREDFAPATDQVLSVPRPVIGRCSVATTARRVSAHSRKSPRTT